MVSHVQVVFLIDISYFESSSDLEVNKSKIVLCCLKLLTEFSTITDRGNDNVRWSFKFYNSKCFKPGNFGKVFLDFTKHSIDELQIKIEEIVKKLENEKRGLGSSNHRPTAGVHVKHEFCHHFILNKALQEVLLDYNWERPDLSSPVKRCTPKWKIGRPNIGHNKRQNMLETLDELNFVIVFGCIPSNMEEISIFCGKAVKSCSPTDTFKSIFDEPTFAAFKNKKLSINFINISQAKLEHNIFAALKSDLTALNGSIHEIENIVEGKTIVAMSANFNMKLNSSSCGFFKDDSFALNGSICGLSPSHWWKRNQSVARKRRRVFQPGPFLEWVDRDGISFLKVKLDILSITASSSKQWGNMHVLGLVRGNIVAFLGNSLHSSQIFVCTSTEKIFTAILSFLKDQNIIMVLNLEYGGLAGLAPWVGGIAYLVVYSVTAQIIPISKKILEDEPKYERALRKIIRKSLKNAAAVTSSGINSCQQILKVQTVKSWFPATYVDPKTLPRRVVEKSKLQQVMLDRMQKKYCPQMPRPLSNSHLPPPVLIDVTQPQAAAAVPNVPEMSRARELLKQSKIAAAQIKVKEQEGKELEKQADTKRRIVEAQHRARKSLQLMSFAMQNSTNPRDKDELAKSLVLLRDTGCDDDLYTTAQTIINLALMNLKSNSAASTNIQAELQDALSRGVLLSSFQIGSSFEGVNQLRQFKLQCLLHLEVLWVSGYSSWNSDVEGEKCHLKNNFVEEIVRILRMMSFRYEPSSVTEFLSSSIMPHYEEFLGETLVEIYEELNQPLPDSLRVFLDREELESPLKPPSDKSRDCAYEVPNQVKQRVIPVRRHASSRQIVVPCLKRLVRKEKVSKQDSGNERKVCRNLFDKTKRKIERKSLKRSYTVGTFGQTKVQKPIRKCKSSKSSTEERRRTYQVTPKGRKLRVLVPETPIHSAATTIFNRRRPRKSTGSAVITESPEIKESVSSCRPMAKTSLTRRSSFYSGARSRNFEKGKQELMASHIQGGVDRRTSLHSSGTNSSFLFSEIIGNSARNQATRSQLEGSKLDFGLDSEDKSSSLFEDEMLSRPTPLRKVCRTLALETPIKCSFLGGHLSGTSPFAQALTTPLKSDGPTPSKRVQFTFVCTPSKPAEVKTLTTPKSILKTPSKTPGKESSGTPDHNAGHHDHYLGYTPKAGVSHSNTPKDGVSFANTPKAGVSQTNTPKTGASRTNTLKTGASHTNAPKAGVSYANTPKPGVFRTNTPKAGVSPKNITHTSAQHSWSPLEMLIHAPILTPQSSKADHGNHCMQDEKISSYTTSEKSLREKNEVRVNSSEKSRLSPLKRMNKRRHTPECEPSLEEDSFHDSCSFELEITSPLKHNKLFKKNSSSLLRNELPLYSYVNFDSYVNVKSPIEKQFREEDCLEPQINPVQPFSYNTDSLLLENSKSLINVEAKLEDLDLLTSLLWDLEATGNNSEIVTLEDGGSSGKDSCDAISELIESLASPKKKDRKSNNSPELCEKVQLSDQFGESSYDSHIENLSFISSSSVDNSCSHDELAISVDSLDIPLDPLVKAYFETHLEREETIDQGWLPNEAANGEEELSNEGTGVREELPGEGTGDLEELPDERTGDKEELLNEMTGCEEEISDEKTNGEEEISAEKTNGEEKIFAEKTSGEEEISAEKTNEEEEISAEKTNGEEEIFAEKTNGEEEISAEKINGEEEISDEKTNGEEELPYEGESRNGVFIPGFFASNKEINYNLIEVQYSPFPEISSPSIGGSAEEELCDYTSSTTQGSHLKAKVVCEVQSHENDPNSGFTDYEKSSNGENKNTKVDCIEIAGKMVSRKKRLFADISGGAISTAKVASEKQNNVILSGSLQPQFRRKSTRSPLTKVHHTQNCPSTTNGSQEVPVKYNTRRTSLKIEEMHTVVTEKHFPYNEILGVENTKIVQNNLENAESEGLHKGKTPLLRNRPSTMGQSAHPQNGEAKVLLSDGKSTLKSDGKSTPKSDGKSTSKSVGKSTPKSDGKSTPKSAGKSTSKSVGKSTPKSDGKSTPKSDGKSTSKSVDKSIPKSDGKSTSKSDGKSTPKSVGKSTLKNISKRTPRKTGKWTPVRNTVSNGEKTPSAKRRTAKDERMPLNSGKRTTPVRAAKIGVNYKEEDWLTDILNEIVHIPLAEGEIKLEAQNFPVKSVGIKKLDESCTYNSNLTSSEMSLDNFDSDSDDNYRIFGSGKMDGKAKQRVFERIYSEENRSADFEGSRQSPTWPRGRLRNCVQKPEKTDGISQSEESTLNLSVSSCSSLKRMSDSFEIVNPDTVQPTNGSFVQSDESQMQPEMQPIVLHIRRKRKKKMLIA